MSGTAVMKVRRWMAALGSVARIVSLGAVFAAERGTWMLFGAVRPIEAGMTKG